MAPTGRIGTFACCLGTTLLVVGMPTALAHGGNPNFRTVFRAVRPAEPGLQVQVLNYDDRLLLINNTHRTVLVQGYDREPYARLLADGTVEVNKRSPSYYLNEERYGGTPAPPSANAKAPPQWSFVSKTGRFEMHDHRIHWMSKGALPPQVKDKDKRTKVFDWRVPISVGSQHAALTGTLFWAPSSGGGIPTAAIVALIVLVLATAILFITTRRLRKRQIATRGGGTDR